jgi:single-stranded DNA-binding protein
MLGVLIGGRLIRDPQVRTGQGGKSFTTALVRVPVDQGEDSLLVSVIAFQETAERLARLKAGDSVSLTGSAKLSSWEKDGEMHHGLAVTASALLTTYDVRQRRGDPRASGASDPAPAAGLDPAPDPDDPLGF